MKICPAFKPHGAYCPLRRDCIYYNNLLDLAILHTDIRMAKESKAVQEIEVKFTTTASQNKCINYEKV